MELDCLNGLKTSKNAAVLYLTSNFLIRTPTITNPLEEINP